MVGIALGVAGGVAGIWLGTSTALAGPINLKHVPADARTVIHVDVEAATGSIIGQFILEHGGELGIKQLEQIKMIEQEIGLNPLEDIFDMTLVFVVDDADEIDVFIVTASGAVDDALEAIKEKIGDGFETERVGGYDVIAIRGGGDPMFLWVESSGHRRTIVAGRDAQRVAEVVSLTKGDGESLADSDSALADVEAQSGAIVFAATLDASEIAKHSLASKLLNEASSLVVQVGEDDGEAFAHVSLGVGEDKAQLIAQMAVGIVAAGQLVAGHEDVASEITAARIELLSAIQFSSDNGNVQVSFRYDVEKFIGLLQEARGDHN